MVVVDLAFAEKLIYYSSRRLHGSVPDYNTFIVHQHKYFCETEAPVDFTYVMVKRRYKRPCIIGRLKGDCTNWSPRRCSITLPFAHTLPSIPTLLCLRYRMMANENNNPTMHTANVTVKLKHGASVVFPGMPLPLTYKGVAEQVVSRGV